MLFATPVEAEEAFYHAFARSDLTAMMQVWLSNGHVECIHPAGPRLQGIDAIRQSWQQIFASGEQLEFQITRHQATQTGNLAIHSVSEHLTVINSDPIRVAEVHSTNIYELTPQGWHMILHHASPAHPAKRTRAATMH